MIRFELTIPKWVSFLSPLGRLWFRNSMCVFISIWRKRAAHMMRPSAGVARWRERPSALTNFKTNFDNLRKKNEEVFNIPLVSLWCLSLGPFFCLERVLPPLSALSVVFFCMKGWRLTSFLPCGGYAAEAGLPNFGSCWQRLKQRAICGGGLGPQNLATLFVEKWHPRFLLIFFQMAWNHHTVVKLDG